MSEYFTVLDEAELTHDDVFVRYQTRDGRVDSIILPRVGLTREAIFIRTLTTQFPWKVPGLF